MRGVGDLPWWSGHGFTGGKPHAAIDNHPAWHTQICDYVERDALAVSVEAILSRTITAAWSSRHREFNFVALGFPTPIQLGPAFAFELERTRRIEARRKHTE